MKRLLAAALLAVMTSALAWTPPPDPDPEAILREALADRLAGRYEDALQKHEWFQREALKVKPALYGVRNSYAVAWWAELGAKYPPAMAALRKFRDDSAQAVRDGRDTEQSFGDAAAINRALDEPRATAALFLEVEKRDPALARKVFRRAEEALIDTGDYAVAGRYIEPARELELAANAYRHMVSSTSAMQDAALLRATAERFFGTAAARVVALLVKLDRRAEAQQMALDVVKISSSETVKDLLGPAIQGRMPPPFATSREPKKAAE